MLIRKNLFLIGLLLFFFHCTGDKHILEPTITDLAKYNFESGLADGWNTDTYYNSQAAYQVSATSTKSIVGNYSLKVDVNLISGSPTLSQGDVFVDMRMHKPFGVSTIPVNLNMQYVSLYLFVPANLLGTAPSALDGIQVYFKDQNYYNWYSTFYNIGTVITTNSWYQLKVQVQKGKGAFEDANFDPAHIIILGVKIGTATTNIANVNVQSSFYIDSISW